MSCCKTSVKGGQRVLNNGRGCSARGLPGDEVRLEDEAEHDALAKGKAPVHSAARTTGANAADNDSRGFPEFQSRHDAPACPLEIPCQTAVLPLGQLWARCVWRWRCSASRGPRALGAWSALATTMAPATRTIPRAACRTMAMVSSASPTFLLEATATPALGGLRTMWSFRRQSMCSPLDTCMLPPSLRAQSLTHALSPTERTFAPHRTFSVAAS